MFSIITYTHSSCKDVWNMYIGQLNKHLPNIRRTFISDENVMGEDTYVYYNDEPYWTHWCDCLMGMRNRPEFFLYMQEDFFLYDGPDIESLQRYCKFLGAHYGSFVRLISNDLTGVSACGDDIFKIKQGDPYYYCMQPTIWRTEDFLDLYLEAKPKDYIENLSYTKAAKELNLDGYVVYNGEAKRGAHHYNSSVFPYVATGLVRRKWNTLEYPEELERLTNEYGIDMNERGHYNPEEQQEW